MFITRLGGRNLFRITALLFCTVVTTIAATETDVVLNEVMYHAPLDLDDLQYIELFNRGKTEVDLSRWSFTKGVKFVFPEKTRLAPGAYLLVCRKRDILLANYGTNLPVAGEFSGRLSHRGEKIELSNSSGVVVDSLKYEDQAPWPMGADGCSASLERICPYASGQDPGNWAGSILPPFETPAGTPGRKNDNYSTNLPPIIEKTSSSPGAPMQPVTVTTHVRDTTGAREVTLLWRTARTGGETEERKIPMRRMEGDEHSGTYQGSIEPQPSGTLVRWRIKAVNTLGTHRFAPAPTEPRPAYSYSATTNTNTARIAFFYLLNISASQGKSEASVWNGRRYRVATDPTRGNAAIIYAPPNGGQVLTFDFVRTRPRNGGFKAHFLKDQTFKGMTGINVIFEGSPRWLLSEPMAYELYRLAGVPACLTEHVRTWEDGHLVGYRLLIEQPNKGFLRRNRVNDGGYLYKVYWFQQGLVGQHAKKTRLATTSDNLVALHKGLTSQSGAAQWDFIQKNFNVDEFTGYYAVNMCIQNWDGFFNNYYLYYDAENTGKWEMYPWDEDKTWGDYDGVSPKYDWYTMPLTYGMNESSSRPMFGFGGGGWWRPPGWFSGPLLANQEFRRAFLTRLKAICTNAFTEEKMIPLIDAMEHRLEAEMTGGDLNRFHSDIQSLRNQVKHRRKFILEEIPKDAAWR